ncbi:MAG: UDP-N-acetylmuramate dehydrogenase [Candidatus Roizmanbacteria bacterium]
MEDPKTQLLQDLVAFLGEAKVKINKDIGIYLTIRTPAIAEYYIDAESDSDIQKVIQIAHNHSSHCIIIGGGSNIIAVKSLINGIVIHNRSIKKEKVNETFDTVDMLYSSGYSISQIVRETSQQGWSGFEKHLGLPGTVGGAIYMNSKWSHGGMISIGDILVSATILDMTGNIKKVEAPYFQFAYDFSILQETKEIVLDATFRLKKSTQEQVESEAQKSLQYRKDTQPFGVATCGCFFRNISLEDKQRLHLPSVSVGQLIDNLGLKGISIGGFMISDKHANFIVNTGNGNISDLILLINLIKLKVKDKYNIDLKEEVEMI